MIIKLELGREYYVPICFQQFDEGAIQQFQILREGVPFNLTGYSVRMKAIKPDKTKIYNDMIIDNATSGLSTLKLTIQMLLVAGLMELQIEIRKSGIVFSTVILNALIKKSIDPTGLVQSSNEFTALDIALDKVDEWNAYFQATSGKIEEKYTVRLTSLELQLEEKTTQINNLNNNKVDKVLGKGLSTNDYNNLEKDEVAKVKNKAEKTEVTTAINDLKANNELTYAKKTEVTNCITPKGNSTYVALPPTGNTIGNYYYCSDGDGTHGAGNYVWNGTSWFFGGTGDEGYSILKEDMAISGIIKNIDLTSFVKGYITSSNIVSNNTDLGRVDGITLKKGSKISLNAKGYSNTVAMIYKCNNDGTYTSLVASDSNAKKKYEYVAVENMEVGVSFYLNDTRDATRIIEIENAIDSIDGKITYLNVGIGKQFTTLNEAISSIKNPSSTNRYVINIYEGNYETYDSAKLNADYKGMILPDYTDITGVGNRDNIVIYFYGTEGIKQYNNNISTLNVGGHNKIKNITIKGKNCRYCVHDDFLAIGQTEHIFENVKFIIETATVTLSNSSNIPYGAGSEIDKTLIFKNCIFENENDMDCFLFHDITASKMIKGSNITFINCKFLNGRYSLNLTSTTIHKKSNIFMYGCKATKSALIKGDGTSISNMLISGFYCPNFTFVGNGTISQENINSCIDII